MDIKIQVVFMAPPTNVEYEEILEEFEAKLPSKAYSVVYAKEIEGAGRWGVLVAYA